MANDGNHMEKYFIAEDLLYPTLLYPNLYAAVYVEINK